MSLFEDHQDRARATDSRSVGLRPQSDLEEQVQDDADRKLAGIGRNPAEVEHGNGTFATNPGVKDAKQRVVTVRIDLGPLKEGQPRVKQAEP